MGARRPRAGPGATPSRPPPAPWDLGMDPDRGQLAFGPWQTPKTILRSKIVPVNRASRSEAAFVEQAGPEAGPLRRTGRFVRRTGHGVGEQLVEQVEPFGQRADDRQGESLRGTGIVPPEGLVRRMIE